MRVTSGLTVRGRGPLLHSTAALVLVTALAAGCGIDDEPDEKKKPKVGKSSPRYTGPMVKNAVSAFAMGRVSRLEMKQIERYPDRSVLRFSVANPSKETHHFSYATSVAGSAFNNIHFTLIDPVHNKAYTPMYDDNGNGKTVGSDLANLVTPGARYEAVLAFPPLPAHVRTLTVATPTTAGEYTGVPVVDGKGPMTPSAPVPSPGTTPAPGSTVAFPTRPQNGPMSGGTTDLYSLTEGTVKSTTTTNTEQKIGLRTDVLFDFDKATLTAKAKEVLDQVATETKANADPAKPPVIITGHTDTKGDDPYNLRLSNQRAQAVLTELRNRLGTAYQYRADGKGETEPVAAEGGADDEQARQKNRRVEISYKIKQQSTQSSTATERKQKDERAIGTGAPAPFRPTDGPTVATRTVDFTRWTIKTKRRMDVKAFYRDGAYLVAVFEITNLGPRDILPTEDYMGEGGSYGEFGAFTVSDPATNIIYRAVRMGPAAPPNQPVNLNFVDSGWTVFNEKPNTSNRGFFYAPAPPPNVKSVTFDAGAFGKFPNIPIQ
ncbi:OmpA family protein [Spirillospora sp. CA-294931]|uniref:OmpA family protein n=1 Tax=Spirillospora sp. CA-294931 TaxID=3240042 RepID=UPI003D94848C